MNLDDAIRVMEKRLKCGEIACDWNCSKCEFSLKDYNNNEATTFALHLMYYLRKSRKEQYANKEEETK